MELFFKYVRLLVCGRQLFIYITKLESMAATDREISLKQIKTVGIYLSAKGNK